MSDATGPLADVRILDLTRLLPGGFCTLLLGDLGADVIKVEDTGAGDYVRWAPPYYGAEEEHRRSAPARRSTSRSTATSARSGST